MSADDTRTVDQAKADKDARTRGVWVAYYPDGSSATPHRSEIAALRDAVGGQKQVTFVPFGTPIEEAAKKGTSA